MQSGRLSHAHALTCLLVLIQQHSGVVLLDELLSLQLEPMGGVNYLDRRLAGRGGGGGHREDPDRSHGPGPGLT